MNTERIWVLLAKRKSGEATNDELTELNDLLQSEEENTENEIVDKIWNAPLQPLPEMKPGEDLWKRIKGNINEPVLKPLIFGRIARWTAAAAIVTAIIATGAFLNRQKSIEILRLHKT